MAVLDFDADLAEQVALLSVVNDDVYGKVKDAGKGKGRATESAVEDKPAIRFAGDTVGGDVMPIDGPLFIGVCFDDCNINGAKFENCVFINVLFKDCTFEKTMFTNLVFKNVQFTDRAFGQITWRDDELLCDKPTEHPLTSFDLLTIGEGIPAKLTDTVWLDIQRATLLECPTVEEDAELAAEIKAKTDEDDKSRWATWPDLPMPSSSNGRDKKVKMPASSFKPIDTDQDRVNMMTKWNYDWYGPSAKFDTGTTAETAVVTTSAANFKEFKPVESEAERRAVKQKWDNEWYGDSSGSGSSSTTRMSTNYSTQPAVVPHFKLGVTARRELSASNMAKLNGEGPSRVKQSAPQIVNARLEAMQRNKAMAQGPASPVKISPAQNRYISPVKAPLALAAPPTNAVGGSPRNAFAASSTINKAGKKDGDWEFIEDEGDDLIDFAYA